MKQVLNGALAGTLALLVGLSCSQSRRDFQSNKNPRQSPFLLSVVPQWSNWDRRGISMAENMPRTFYVVLKNVSMEPQATFEAWNSWGYDAIHFEVEAADGHRFTISKKPQGFGKNTPTTFVVRSGSTQYSQLVLTTIGTQYRPFQLQTQNQCRSS